MKLYISGPMTGKPNLNYDLFHVVANTLRGMGHTVFNPAESFGGDQSLPYSAYMREDISAILQCDALILLDEWQQSRGAKVEVAVAQAIGLQLFVLLPDGIREHGEADNGR